MQSYLVKFLIWRIKHISDRNFILLLASIVGALSGLAAVTLKQSAHWIEKLLTQGFDIEYANYLYFSFPLIGIILTYWIAKYILKDKLGHGITGILYDISKGSSKIKPIRTISRMITGAITVGFGG